MFRDLKNNVNLAKDCFLPILQPPFYTFRESFLLTHVFGAHLWKRLKDDIIDVATLKDPWNFQSVFMSFLNLTLTFSYIFKEL